MSIHAVRRINESNYEEGAFKITASSHDSKQQFLSQEDIWSQFKDKLETHLNSNSLSYTVLAVGCNDSGKSYTLLGNCESEDNRGVLPRCLQYIFIDRINKLKIESVQFSAYLIDNETIVDLFDPTAIYSYKGALAYSTTLGPMILPVSSPIATSYDQSISLLGLILQSYSIIRFNSANFYAGSSLVISLRLFSQKNNNMFQLTFCDIASLSCPDVTLPSLNRFAGASLKHHSVRVMKSSMKKLHQVDSITQSSILTYLLQDTLYKAKNTFFFACMSGRYSSRKENEETMSFVDTFVSWSATSLSDDNTVSNSCNIAQIFMNLDLELIQITKNIDEKLREEKINEKKSLLRNVEEANLKVKSKNIVQKDPDIIPSDLHSSVKESLVLRMKRFILRQFRDGYLKLSKNEILPYLKICNMIFIDNFGNRIRITHLLDDNEETLSSSSRKGGDNKDINRKTAHIYEYLSRFITKNGVALLGKQYDMSPFYDKNFIEGTNSTDVNNKLLVLQKSPSITTRSNNFDTIKWSHIYSSMEDPFVEFIGPSDCISKYARCKFKLNGYSVIKGSEVDLLTPSASLIGHIFQPFSHGSKQDFESRILRRRQEDEIYARNLVQFLLPNNENDDIQQLLNSPELKDVNIIQVVGPDISPFHCIFKEEYDSIKLIPTASNSNNSLFSRIILNGHLVEEEVYLEDQDILLFGYSRFFRVNIPRRPFAHNDEKIVHSSINQKQSSWNYSLLRSFSSLLKSFIFDSEVERRTNNHLKVSRETTYVTKYGERNELTSMKTFEPLESDVSYILESIPFSEKCRLCTLIGCSIYANFLSEKMRRLVHIQFFFKEFIPSTFSYNDNLKRYQSDDSNITSIQIKPFADFMAENESKSFIHMHFQSGVSCTPSLSGGSWLWSSEVFQERFSLMEETNVFFCGPWCEKDPSWLDKRYTSENDTFKDTLDDELIGVGFLYLDSLQYLLDIDDSIPIVSLNGSISGYIKMKVRVWIDQIEMLPSYLTVDKECHIRDYTNHKLIINFYFEGLNYITEDLSSSTYVYFKFFSHNKGYKTSRSSQKNRNPSINETIKIEQRISKDFEEYIKSGCIELEVFGKRQQATPSTIDLRLFQRIVVGENDDNNNFLKTDIDDKLFDIVEKCGERYDKYHTGSQINELQTRLVELQVACDAKERELEESSKILDQIKHVISSKSSTVTQILASDVDAPSDIVDINLKTLNTTSENSEGVAVGEKINKSQRIKPTNVRGQKNDESKTNSNNSDGCFLQ